MRWKVGAACATLAVCAWAFYPVMAVQYRESRDLQLLAAEKNALEERNSKLQKQVDKLKTPAGVEDYARSQLGLVKKGENVLVVIDGEDSTEPTATSKAPELGKEQTPEAGTGPWTAFLDLVFGYE